MDLRLIGSIITAVATCAVAILTAVADRKDD